jgi:hypothetical protein
MWRQKEFAGLIRAQERATANVQQTVLNSDQDLRDTEIHHSLIRK